MTSEIHFSAAEILSQLDVRTHEHQFITLDGGKELPADCRLTLYADHVRWALVAEQLIYATQSPGFWGMADLVYYAGNCVRPVGRRNTATVQVVKDAPGEQAFTDPIGFDVNRSLRAVSIRDRIVRVDLSEDALRRKKISMSADGKLHGQQLLWSLLPEHRDLLLAGDEEKRKPLPPDLPMLMQLEEWNHPLVLTNGELPSQSETFRMLAEVLETADPNRYQPTLPPNTDWHNWVSYPRI